MSHPVSPEPVCFFIAFITKEKSLLNSVLPILENQLGKLIYSSDFFEFSKFTDYYNSEMGFPLFKNFLFFSSLKSPEFLVQLKHFCYKIEKDFSNEEGKRRVNLDPGYIELSKVVLSTFKNFSHRIYLGNNVYGEVTLIFKKGNFHPLPWTYPDYSANIEIFLKAREIYKSLLKNYRC